MAERRIQYATTRDGVNIAVCTWGEGEPLVHFVPLGVSATKPEQLPYPMRRLYEQLAERRQLIRFDVRGTGLSDRELPPLTLEALTEDILAVMNRMKLETADLFAVSSTGPSAIAFAAMYPERVRHLVVWCTSANGREIQSSSRLAIDSLAQQDWKIYTETLASATFGWGEAEDARRLATLVRETTTPEGRGAYYGLIRETDVTELLPKVEAPTLVVHFRGYPLVPVACATRLAAQLPNADLALFEGSSLFPAREDIHLVLDAVDEFLGGPGGFEPAPAPGQPHTGSGLCTILFTDVEGSTALTQRLGDVAARRILRQHEKITRQALADYGGSEVKALGDGFLASFESASRALECAVSIQQSFEVFNNLGNEPIRVRIGINAGEPIVEGTDLFGTAVNLTARIAAQAQGWQVLVSDVVRQLVAGKGFLFSDHGDVMVRGFEDPVRLYELRWGNRPVGGRTRAGEQLDGWRRTYFDD